jgi:hypothetical protein
VESQLFFLRIGFWSLRLICFAFPFSKFHIYFLYAFQALCVLKVLAGINFRLRILDSTARNPGGEDSSRLCTLTLDVIRLQDNQALLIDRIEPVLKELVSCYPCQDFRQT